MEYCWIQSCKNYKTYVKDLDLYPLPDNPEERALWVKAFGLERIHTNTRICGAHFRRKYFLGKRQETNTIVNGSAPMVLMNNPRAPLLNQTLIRTTCLQNDIATASTNSPLFMTFQENPSQGSYILHIPEVNNTSNIQHAPVPLQNAPIPHQKVPIPHQKVPIPLQNAPIPLQNAHPISNKLVKPQIAVSDHSSDIRTRVIKSVIVDSCELFCQEEKLTPEQEKFQYDEWLNYVKFTSNVQNLPSVKVAKASEIGEKVPGGIASPPELPLLIYSNAAPQPQPVILPPVPSPASNTPFLVQIPQNISSPLSAVSPTLTPNVVPPFVPAQFPGNKLQSSTVFPVRLEKSEVISQNPVQSNSKEEEIFPFILQDGATESLFNKVVCCHNGETRKSILAFGSHGIRKVKEASLPSQSLPAVSDMIVDDKSDTNSASGSPIHSIDSEDGKCNTPDPLCHVEVNIEENETESILAPMTPENASTSLGSDVSLDESNGPKIVDVISGEGASELFKSTVLENDRDHIAEKKENKSDGAPVENMMPKTVTQWSIFSMQKTIAVISSGSVEATVRNLLGVRLHIPPITSERDIATQLKNRLRDEHFLTQSAWWLIQKQYLPLNPPCTSCAGTTFQINSCFEFLDGLCWVCNNKKCRKIYPVKRPKFFERFPSFSLEELLLLTYHWACKSRIWIINYDVPVHAERIWAFFTALQELCGESLSKLSPIGMNTKHTVTVEVSAVKLGKFFVLCAYDRRNKVSRLKAITTEEACGSTKHISILREWLGNNVTLISWKKISDEFLTDVTKVSADPTIGHVQSPGRHILNASKYLGKTMVQLFQNICHDQLTIGTIQNVLNEVQWRERHGQTEEAAFWGIMNEISRLNDKYTYTEAVHGDIAKDRYFYKADVAFRLRWGPQEMGNKTILVDPKRNGPHAAPIHTAVEKSVPAQQVSKAPPAATNKVVNSVNSPVYKPVESPKILHPISVSSIYSNITVKDKVNLDAGGITPEELLSIKISFVTGNVSLDLQRQGVKLGVQLKDEGFLFRPVRWLVSKKYIKDEMPCYVCHGKSKLVDNAKYDDGVSWLCLKHHCRFENKFRRPSFFAYFGFKLDVIFSVIYHWAVQTDSSILLKVVPLNEFNIISIHRKIQHICSEMIKGDNFKIGGRKNLVEVAFVRFANCFILGAMERNSKHSRFRTFSNQSKLNIDEIRRSLISWLRGDSTVIVNSNKYLGRYCMEEKINLVFADQSVTDPASKKYHTLTITHYLQNHMKTMFRSLKVQHMSAELLQIYLDELVWRERYGRTPLNAFNSIMHCIFAMESGEFYVPKVNLETALENRPVMFSSSIWNAASYYGFSLPLPEVKVVLERLPQRVIDSYTSRGGNDVRMKDRFEPTKEAKQEMLSSSDDEIEILIPDSKQIEVVDLDSDTENSPSEEKVDKPGEKVIAPNDKIVASLEKDVASLKEKDVAAPNEKDVAALKEKDVVVPKEKDVAAPKEKVIAASSEKVVAASKEIDVTAPKEKIIVGPEENVVAPDETDNSSSSSSSSASSPVSSYSFSPHSTTPSPPPSLASSSSFSSTSNQNCGTSSSLPENFPVPTKNKSNISVNKCDLGNKRYAAKCYSHNKRKDSDMSTKSMCMECKSIVTAEHFAKLYTCSDCKNYRYSTYCQKSFARHRYYILFGRNISISETTRYCSSISLSEEWFCSCGFGSREGNKLASHLIDCNKTTCYLKAEEEEEVVVEEEEIDVVL